jgi:UDP-N-acetylmuramate--alanine ligase
VFFQPHTYSRTKALLDEFASSFNNADHVLVGTIFAAREDDNLGITARDLVRRMDHPDVRFVASLDEASNYLQEVLQPGDVLLTLGAGDGYLVGEAVLRALDRAGDAGCVQRLGNVQARPDPDRVAKHGS